MVLLTVLVFFNTPVWLDGVDGQPRPRLWLALLFLPLIAAAFIVSATVDRVRPMHGGTRTRPTTTSATGRHAVRDDARSARPRCPLCRAERLNVVFVRRRVAAQPGPDHRGDDRPASSWSSASSCCQPELLAAWTRNGSQRRQGPRHDVPVPHSLIQITYVPRRADIHVHQRARGQRRRLPRPSSSTRCIDDLRLTLMARNRYRAAVSGTRNRDHGGSE